MGYTHYYNFKGNIHDIQNHERKFKDAVELVKAVFHHLPEKVEFGRRNVPLKLFGPLGKGEPIFTDSLIAFNGDKSRGLNHETFAIVRDSNQFGGMSCTFCKTVRAPYDIAVCLAILCFKQVYGEDFKFSSDGDRRYEEGWVVARRILKAHNKENQGPR